jgi:spore maturation protein CgeB
MKILCVFGEHNYGDPSRGQGYEYANFIPALQRLGHEVVFFESLNKTRYVDFADLNRSFLATVEQERPDVVFCVLMAYELWIETLEMAREISQAFFINWSTDDSWKYRQFSRLLAPAFDLYATTSPAAFARAKHDGLNNFYLTQWAAAGARLQEPLAAGQCRYPVSFIGSRYGNRGQWVERLRDKGIDVACFGHGWPRGPVAAEDIPGIIRESVVNLNFGDSGIVMEGLLPSRSRQIKARVFEVPGCGGFLLTQPAEDLERYYMPGREVATFGDLEDLSQKIGHYLAHPGERDQIARAGYVRTRSEHTYEIRFSQLLETAQASRGLDRRTVFPARAASAAETEHFRKLALRHRPHAGLRLLRKALTAPCVWVWGKQRGPRAARRILFELSWRLCGKTTYSAAGWPGRIFYNES